MPKPSDYTALPGNPSLDADDLKKLGENFKTQANLLAEQQVVEREKQQGKKEATKMETAADDGVRVEILSNPSAPQTVVPERPVRDRIHQYYQDLLIRLHRMTEDQTQMLAEQDKLLARLDERMGKKQLSVIPEDAEKSWLRDQNDRLLKGYTQLQSFKEDQDRLIGKSPVVIEQEETSTNRTLHSLESTAELLKGPEASEASEASEGPEGPEGAEASEGPKNTDEEATKQVGINDHPFQRIQARDLKDLQKSLLNLMETQKTILQKEQGQNARVQAISDAMRSRLDDSLTLQQIQEQQQMAMGQQLQMALIQQDPQQLAVLARTVSATVTELRPRADVELSAAAIANLPGQLTQGLIEKGADFSKTPSAPQYRTPQSYTQSSCTLHVIYDDMSSSVTYCNVGKTQGSLTILPMDREMLRHAKITLDPHTTFTMNKINHGIDIAVEKAKTGLFSGWKR